MVTSISNRYLVVLVIVDIGLVFPTQCIKKILKLLTFYTLIASNQQRANLPTTQNLFPLVQIKV